LKKMKFTYSIIMMFNLIFILGFIKKQGTPAIS
jgi:hypothetical protein